MNTRELTSAFLAAHRVAGKPAATLRHYRWALGTLPAALPAHPDQVEAVLARPSWGPHSRLSVWRVFHAFYGWAAARYGTANPMKAVMRPKVPRAMPRVFTESELRRIAGACKTRRDSAIVHFLLDSGARRGEAVSVKPTDVRGGMVRVNGKTGERTVLVSAMTARRLRESGGQAAVFEGRNGPLTPSGFGQAFRRLVRRARIRGPRAGPHTMRHTFATMFLRLGGNVFALQKLMGHASLNTTQMYVHLSGDDIAAMHGTVSVAGKLLAGVG